MSSRCSHPGCRNVTNDPSVRCHHHRVASTLQMGKGSRHVPTPTPTVTQGPGLNTTIRSTMHRGKGRLQVEADHSLQTYLDWPASRLAHLEYVLIEDDLIFTTWRETHPEAYGDGHQTRLQDELLRMYPHRHMVSDPQAMSPSATRFRERYLEENPGTLWELDPMLDDGDYVPESSSLEYRDLDPEAKQAVEVFIAQMVDEVRLDVGASVDDFRYELREEPLQDFVARYCQDEDGFGEGYAAEEFDLHHAEVLAREQVGTNLIPDYGNSPRWPVIVEDENPNYIDDGYHRFHSYVRSGATSVPTVRLWHKG